MSEFKGKSSAEDAIPVIQEFEGFGEITAGGSVAGGDVNRILFISLALLNHPIVNSYLLANKVKVTDRTTKTEIFPRDGMSLQGGEVFSVPQKETSELSAE
jgi:hypothetical protein